MDRLELNIQMPLTKDESISQVSIISYYDVKLSSKAKYAFDAVSYFTYDGSSALSKLSVDGDLTLRQTWPLLVLGG